MCSGYILHILTNVILRIYLHTAKKVWTLGKKKGKTGMAQIQKVLHFRD